MKIALAIKIEKHVNSALKMSERSLKRGQKEPKR